MQYNEFHDSEITIKKEAGNKFVLELSMKAIHGNEAAIQKTFEAKYPKFQISITADKVKIQGELKSDIGEELSLVRRHVAAAMFYDALEKQKEITAGNNNNNNSKWLKMDMGKREHFYFKVSNDRLVLFQQMSFASEEDFMLAKNWAQELCDMRAQPSHTNAPPVSYVAKEEPADLKGELVKAVDEYTLVFTWILFPVHVRPDKLEMVIDSLAQFTISIRESLIRMRTCITAKLQKHFDEQKKSLDAINKSQPNLKN